MPQAEDAQNRFLEVLASLGKDGVIVATAFIEEKDGGMLVLSLREDSIEIKRFAWAQNPTK